MKVVVLGLKEALERGLKEAPGRSPREGREGGPEGGLLLLRGPKGGLKEA